MIVLGISALYHDAAASIVVDGKIVAAAQEERFTRKKHDPVMPVNAIRYCLKKAGIAESEPDYVVFYDNPLYTLDRYMKNMLAAGGDSRDVLERSFVSMFSEKIWIHNIIKKIFHTDRDGFQGKVLVCEHHMSHAASAFYPSPFHEAVIITMDGVGEWETTTVGIGRGKEIEIKETIYFPHSLGLLYSAFTYFCGFKVNSGDYKFMGLAPYGEPVYADIIRKNIIDIKNDGSYRLNLEYFDFQYGRTMTSKKFDDLFDGPARAPETRITKREMDIAASAQEVLEEIMLKTVRHAKEAYGRNIDNLVLAGGVALNCVANGKIKNSGVFQNIWIQPAAGDAGGSLGCALYAAYHAAGGERQVIPEDSQQGSLLGPEYSITQIREYLDQNHYVYHELTDEELFRKIAKELASGKVTGLFQGRMEFGPRALGARSIIADPRSEQMQVRLNMKIKYRESFRPFAPSVLREQTEKYFELKEESPYMLLVDNICQDRCLYIPLQEELETSGYDMLDIVSKKRSDIPAVTHVDYSARIQTVSESRNGYYYKLLRAFEEQTGCGVIVNTSFNVRGEPIVCTPVNAYECFMRTEMDVLVLENLILYKEEQPEWKESTDWRSQYELD